MATHPQFLFDFGSPNAFLAHKVLPAIEARTGASFDYIPVLLGGVFKATGNQSPITAFAHIPAKLAYERLEIERFVAKYGIEGFHLNPHFPINSLMLMRGAVAAEELGVFSAYVDAVFDAMWVRGLKMDDPEIVGQALDEAGLATDRLLALAQSDAVKQRLIANTEAAVARGVFGSPSFIVGDALYFGKDRLREVEEAIVGES